MFKNPEKTIYLFMILFGAFTFWRIATFDTGAFDFLEALGWGLIQLGAVVIMVLGFAALAYEQSKKHK